MTRRNKTGMVDSTMSMTHKIKWRLIVLAIVVAIGVVFSIRKFWEGRFSTVPHQVMEGETNAVAEYVIHWERELQDQMEPGYIGDDPREIRQMQKAGEERMRELAPGLAEQLFPSDGE